MKPSSSAEGEGAHQQDNACRTLCLSVLAVRAQQSRVKREYMNSEELKTMMAAIAAQLQEQQQKGFQEIHEYLQSPAFRASGASELPTAQGQVHFGASTLPNAPDSNRMANVLPTGPPPGSKIDLDEDQDNEVDPQWTDILKSRRHTATTPDGQLLGKLLSQPPPLLDLKHAQSDIKLYQDVPESPPPTRHIQDKRLFDAQVKIEAALHLIMQSMEINDKQPTVEACAWLRSSWEDLLQARRKGFAGKQAWKLDARKDDNKPKLVSPEEEKKLRTGKGKGTGKGNGKGKGAWGTQRPSQWGSSGRPQQKSWTYRIPRSTPAPRKLKHK